MMLQSAWLFVGVVAILATATALGTDDDGVAILAGTAGTITWGVWTYGTLNVEAVDGAGSTLTFTMPSLTLLGIALALVPAYVALTGPVELVARANRQPDTEDL